MVSFRLILPLLTTLVTFWWVGTIALVLAHHGSALMFTHEMWEASRLGAILGAVAFLILVLIDQGVRTFIDHKILARMKSALMYRNRGSIIAPFIAVAYAQQAQVQYWDVWYSDATNALVGTASWVFMVLVTAYYLLKWMNNDKKFYRALKKQLEGGEAR
ncbi:MAG: hypothetical protein NZ988_04915 [Thaumarchaeota archaeon]|nr:hypothetical protein [Candidatus Calditenuaceae archaeon]MDW8187367.1 hypothetical protein [Nitrososphaerota archaeon]